MDELSETAALRAMAHPLRLRMLSLLTGAELSAAEVARELGITHANASYHLRVLLDAGELEVAGEEKIRGGVASGCRSASYLRTPGRGVRRAAGDGREWSGVRRDRARHALLTVRPDPGPGARVAGYPHLSARARTTVTLRAVPCPRPAKTLLVTSLDSW